MAAPVDRAGLGADGPDGVVGAGGMVTRVSPQGSAQKERRLTFPESLPVSARRDDIMAAIRDHQVVIVAGETGSGKTTQLPKMCLALGRGRRKLIGHTQPRRIAARSVADRIADELGETCGQPGGRVGYKIRFDDTVRKSTSVKLMTDGILLAEIQRDRLLRAYDTIIVDEAHERSLNIDFLLGYLREILPRRPDLKVIITSATIDPDSFARHFADADGTPAPVIEVSGRTYPVEVRYRPLTRTVPVGDSGEVREEQTDPLDGLVAACTELMGEGPGDILCFFSGEREIRDAADALTAQHWRNVDILPLFGRLSNAEQHRVFSTGPHRRIVLATNIAETSLTVPGIKYVVDTGYARISRYSHRTKVQRLPVEEISQASARQRSGRCGRTSDGIAVRLYSEENFEARPEFTDPEILRTHLASVILSMAALDLGDIEKFPFLQPPDSRAVKDGLRLLRELGAITDPRASGDDADRAGGADGGGRDTRGGRDGGGGDDHNAGGPTLTPVGRDLARIPTDPRLARMLVAAHENNVLEQLAVIVAALSIQDVRERPLEHQPKADQLHARFAGDSDFTSVLALWNYLQEKRRELSGNAFRRLCGAEFIHYMRVREWMDLVRQLLSTIQDLRWKVPNIRHVRDLTFDDLAVDDEAVHRSILTGVLTNVGMKNGTGRQFTGTRSTTFTVHPSSNLAKNPPQWIMAAELVETSRLFARTVGPIASEWVEQVAPHMVRYVHSEPHWSSSRGAAMVHEKVLMLGLPIVADRRVPLSRTDPAEARTQFIRHALVEGDWTTRHAFFHRNREVLAEVGELEDKARRRDIVVDDQVVFDFYDARIPADVVSSRHFDSWWKKASRRDPHALDIDPESLIDSDSGAAHAQEYPDVWRQGSLEFELSYVFSPGDPDDGITMRVPLPLLATVDGTAIQWLVTGMRHELVVALIRSLPKALRTSVVPATNFADAALRTMVPFDGPLDVALADALRSLGGRGISAGDFDWSRVPGHLRMTVAAVDRRGKVVDADKDLAALKDRLAGEVTQAIAQVAARSSGGGRGSGPSPEDAALHGRDHSGKGGEGSRRGRRRGGRASGGGAAAQSGGSAGSGGAGTGATLARAAAWTADGLGTVPDSVDTVVDGQSVQAYPAVVATGDGVALTAFPTPQAAAAQQFKTVLDMMVAACTVSTNQMVKGLPLRQRVAVENYPSGGPEALVNDARVVACRDLLDRFGPVIRDPDRCAEAVDAARRQGPGLVRQTVVAVAPAVLAVADMTDELAEWTGEPIEDMRAQLRFYMGDHALARHGVARLRHVPRYVEAMKARLAMMDSDPEKEEDLDAEVREAVREYEQTISRLPSARAASPQVKDVRWLIEELRVALFAQHLGTATTASLTRVRKALAKLS